MNTTVANDSPDEGEVHPHVFAAELARTVYADLDGVIFDANAAADNALAVIREAAAADAPRTVAVWLLLRAALAAHRALRFGLQDHFAEPHAADVAAALAEFVETSRPPDAASLSVRGGALAALITTSEGDRESLHSALARAIYRLYDGLRTSDETLGGRGLVELRTMLTHVDAAAQLTTDAASAPLAPVVRPDRFHDEFLRYVGAAQAGSADVQKPVAALQKDGRLTALVTQDVHPVEFARDAIDQDVPGVRLRIETLLDFLQHLRASPESDPLLRNSSENETVFTALITAAATTPLIEGQDFLYPALAQITRYNLRLLQAAARTPERTH